MSKESTSVGTVSAEELAAAMRWLWPVMDHLMEGRMQDWSNEDLLTAHCCDFVRDKALSLLAAVAKAKIPLAAAASIGGGGAGGENLARVLLKLAYRYAELKDYRTEDEAGAFQNAISQLAAMVPKSVIGIDRDGRPTAIEVATVEAEAFALLRSATPVGEEAGQQAKPVWRVYSQHHKSPADVWTPAMGYGHDTLEAAQAQAQGIVEANWHVARAKVMLEHEPLEIDCFTRTPPQP